MASLHTTVSCDVVDLRDRVAALLIVMAMAAPMSSVQGAEAAAKPRPPNLLIILTDDK